MDEQIGHSLINSGSIIRCNWRKHYNQLGYNCGRSHFPNWNSFASPKSLKEIASFESSNLLTANLFW